MASVLVVLVFCDTFLSGWLLAQVLGIKKVIAQMGEVDQSLLHEVGTMKVNLDLVNATVSGISDAR